MAGVAGQETPMDTGTAAAAHAPFDLADLTERTCGDRELLLELVEIFRADTPEQMRTLRAAMAAGDAHGAERRAHHLRGSLSNLAARPAADAALDLESRARAGALEEAGEALVRLEREIARLDAALGEYLAGPVP
jgi:HPt (histidine-containing phosphotransfer) domain-containing protein